MISVGHLLDVHRYVFVILMRNKFNMLCRKHKFFATGETLLFLNYYYYYLRKYTEHKQKCINIRIPVTIPDLSVNRLVFSIEFFCFDYVLWFFYSFILLLFIFCYVCFFVYFLLLFQKISLINRFIMAHKFILVSFNITYQTLCSSADFVIKRRVQIL